MKITNLTGANMDFVVGVENGAAKTDHVKPGETKDIAVSEDDPTFKARLHVGSIRVERGRGKAEKPAA